MTAPVADRAEIDHLPIDYAAVLRHLGLNGNDAKSQAVVLVCKRYDLDPVLKHVVLVEGNVYVTRDGLLHVAHGTGQLDGIEVEEATLSEDGKEWRSRASVYRKDMTRPFAFSGRFPAGRKNSPEMAEKVAVARCLKHAFSVAIATDDERQAQDSTPVTVQPAPVTAADILAKPSPLQTIDAEVVQDEEPLWPDVATVPE
jgi:hypothetical protein